MEKMISPNGVKANMCCASCLYSKRFFTRRNIKRWCAKKDKAIIDGGDKCGDYEMAKFFQEQGYKIIKD